MLNYVWTGLIFLGLLAAVISDISEDSKDRFKNNQKILATLELDKNFSDDEKKNEGVVKISPLEYKSIFEDEIANPVTLEASFSSLSAGSSANFTATIADNSPKLLKDMAEVSGEENDITGKISNLKKIEDGVYSGTVVFETVNLRSLKNVTNAALDYALIAVEIVLGLIGIMALWLGIMKIADQAGIISYIAAAARPITKFLFPEIPHNHPAIGSMIMNISATFLGLGNAATPFGIKAMEDLDKLNDNKGTATNAMCTFLVINTASFALMPTTAIALRASVGSSQPAIIIGTTMFGSLIATIVGITAAKTFEKFPLKFSEVVDWIRSNLKKIFFSAVILAAAALLISFGAFQLISSIFSFIGADLLRVIIQIISIIAIPLIILIFVVLGAVKKVKIYETFVEGAKEGFEIAVTIIPYLVAILMAIGIFRAGGAMDWLVYILSPITNFIGMPAEALPMALMRPLSGSGSLGIMAEIIAVHGPDSFIGILVSTFFGSTETTFYVLAVYFGAVNIKNTRHALPAGLISDIAGILAALFIVRLLFG